MYSSHVGSAATSCYHQAARSSISKKKVSQDKDHLLVAPLSTRGTFPLGKLGGFPAS